MDNYFEKIIKSKKPCYFISPHLDDAALSCGALIQKLSASNSVKVVNVFTKGRSAPYTLSAKQYLKQCGYSDGEQLYKDRVKEDATALGKITKSIINLDFEEALFRRKNSKALIPEFQHIYPTYKLHIVKGPISKFDERLMKDLEKKLMRISKKSVVFCPAGFGNHVDHRIVKKVCEKLFPNVVFWSDYPYPESSKQPFSDRESVEYEINQKIKLSLLRKYKTQFKALFKKTIPNLPSEKYFIPKAETHTTKQYGFLSATLQEEWEMMWGKSKNSTPFNSPQWLKAAIETYKYKSLKIIAVRNKKSLSAILPLVKTEKYNVSLFTDPADFFLDKSSLLLKDKEGEALEKLLSSLHSVDYFLRELPEYIATSITQSSEKIIKRHASVVPYINLSEDPFKDVSKKQKSKIKNKLEKNKKDLKLKTTRGDKKSLLTVFSIDQKSYKSSSGKEIFKNSIHRKFYVNLLKNFRKDFRIDIVYYKKIPIVYSIGITNKNSYYALHTSFLPNYSHLSPGKVLLFLMLEKLKREEFKLFDFSRGKSTLKHEFTSTYTTQQNVIHINNRPTRYIFNHVITTRKYITENENLYSVAKKTRQFIRL